MQRRDFLTGLLGGLSGMLMPVQAKPQRQAIILQETSLAGFQYHEGEALWPELREGLPSRLAREADNRYDLHAVAVYLESAKLGYMPRQTNYTIAQMQDRGQGVNVEIARLRVSQNPWGRMTLRVTV